MYHYHPSPCPEALNIRLRFPTTPRHTYYLTGFIIFVYHLINEDSIIELSACSPGTHHPADNHQHRNTHKQPNSSKIPDSRYICFHIIMYFFS